jgi:hypothetical protein
MYVQLGFQHSFKQSTNRWNNYTGANNTDITTQIYTKYGLTNLEA